MSTVPQVAGDDEVASNRLKWRWTRSRTLGQEFDPRINVLNAWRLTLATGVILWHSWPLTGRRLSIEPVRQLLADGFVDGFFAISGFLITWSWFRHPRARDYFLARGLRIMPGFWACLIATAFVIAPIGVAIQGGSAAELLRSRAPLEYVFRNSTTSIYMPDIGGTPVGVPLLGVWNGSLWTLFWEGLCYIAIAILGAVGLLHRRWLIPALLALVLYWSIKLPPTRFVESLATQQHLDAGAEKLFMDVMASRFACMFLAGAALYRFRDMIPARWSLVAVSSAIVLAASWLPNYRVVAAIPLAYTIIVSGALIRNKRLSLRTDLSYGVYIYAFPVQQFLVICGLAFLNPFAFAIIAAIATLPLAALSWFLIEKPAISLKSRFRRRKIAPAGKRQSE